jgi:hypothetical protein
MTKRKTSGRQSIAAGGIAAFERRPNSHERPGGPAEVSVLALFLVATLLRAPLAMAKQKPPATKTISGQVLDASSHGISGATVLLTDLQTHKTTAIYSGSSGNYNFSGLTAYHDYEVQARYQALTSSKREVSSMDARLQIVVNLTLSPTGSADSSQ